jgi:hypothetical protein
MEEFPEDESIYAREAARADAYDERRAKYGPRLVPMAADQTSVTAANVALDIKVVQKDRAQTMRGYPFVTFDEMDVESPAKQWLIKNIIARARHRGGLRRQAR